MMKEMNPRHDDIASALPADLDALPRLHGFRLRGIQMTRLETFIDAAFAFAISMLVIAAQQIPDNIVALPGGLLKMCRPLSAASRCWASFGGAIGCGAGVTASKIAPRF
jgi:hypothetical protein